MKTFLSIFFSMVLILLTGCRGYRTSQEPFHLNPNMDWQPKYKAQTLSLPTPRGTLPRSAGGKLIERDCPMPPVTTDILLRGQERFNIYCSVCHDKTGSGKGIVVARGFLPPPNLSEARIIRYTDKELYDIVTNGIRNMPAYGKQISPKDRWAIILYVRALQLSQKQYVPSVSSGVPSQNLVKKAK